ncbi:ABC transporter ATP-binding protein [Cerasicoccus fimbriatus]|uniref:ABC transporter ATP-binding protein n=1 Tax=Cerasicoccus fimbriatus TaxID=3014554 RepID=UPI0022B51E4A|nr:ABC transporter ATP-binding protein [Cerasicoccus sp. TK19100]
MSKPAIQVSNITKRYKLGGIGAGSLRDDLVNFWNKISQRRSATSANTFTALDDISFEVQPGEILGIIGHNGAGKSTLLKILSRITEPTSGEAVIHGRVSSLLEVGTGFHPELSGRDNIYLSGAVLGMSKAEIASKFDQIVAFSELEKFIDTPIKRYSSGMTVRLGFAVAAHLDSDIMIVDEVLAVGDARFQHKCLNMIRDIQRRGRTILFVSHNSLAIESLCTRTILLKAGKIIKDGEPHEVMREYLQSDTFNVEGRILANSGSLNLTSFSAQYEFLSPEQCRITCDVELSDIDCPEDFYMDLELDTNAGTRILQLVTLPRDYVLHKRNGGPIKARYEILCSVLAPGDYKVNLYAYNPAKGVLLHFTDIAAFTVSAEGAYSETRNDSYKAVLCTPFNFKQIDE